MRTPTFETMNYAVYKGYYGYGQHRVADKKRGFATMIQDRQLDELNDIRHGDTERPYTLTWAELDEYIEANIFTEEYVEAHTDR